MTTIPNLKTRINWSLQEQQMIKQLRQKEMIASWSLIADRINQTFLNKNRSGKQCRQRYMNYMKFHEHSSEIKGWTLQQDQQLLINFQKHGPKWSFISLMMVGRSQNCLKNRFNGILRKIMRKIYKYEKLQKSKKKIITKTSLIYEILLQNEQKNTKLYKKQTMLTQQHKNFKEQLSKKIIYLGLKQDENFSRDQWVLLIQEIRKYKNEVLSLIKNFKAHKNMDQKLSVEVQQEKFQKKNPQFFNFKNANLVNLSRINRNGNQFHQELQEISHFVGTNQKFNHDLFDDLNQIYPKFQLAGVNQMFY